MYAKHNRLQSGGKKEKWRIKKKEKVGGMKTSVLEEAVEEDTTCDV